MYNYAKTIDDLPEDTKLSFIEPRKWKPPPKKSGSQKLLDKIIGK